MNKVPRTGLVSVSFRKLTVPEIVDLCVRSGCKVVEWGGDVHVPPNDLAAARKTAALCADNQLEIAAYGSYCRLGISSDEEIDSTIAAAEVLGAPVIRVWAGAKGSENATKEDRENVVSAAIAIAERASRKGIRVGLEFHANTLTDTTDSTVRLLREVSHPNLQTLWQVPVSMPREEAEKSLQQIIPWLSHLHVFHWWPTSAHRLPLSDGAKDWKKYLQIVKNHGLTPDLLLEFLPNDDPDLVERERSTLQGWISEIYHS